MTAEAPQSSPQTAERNLRKERIGEVVSTKMNRTIVVRVERRFAHPRFRKVVRQFKKYYAHDEKNEANVGDKVKIAEVRPMSKLKRWRLKEIVRANVEAVKTGS